VPVPLFGAKRFARPHPRSGRLTKNRIRVAPAQRHRGTSAGGIGIAAPRCSAGHHPIQRLALRAAVRRCRPHLRAGERPASGDGIFRKAVGWLLNKKANGAPDARRPRSRCELLVRFAHQAGLCYGPRIAAAHRPCRPGNSHSFPAHRLLPGRAAARSAGARGAAVGGDQGDAATRQRGAGRFFVRAAADRRELSSKSRAQRARLTTKQISCRLMSICRPWRPGSPRVHTVAPAAADAEGRFASIHHVRLGP